MRALRRRALDAHAEDNGCRTNRETYPLYYAWSTPRGAAPATQAEFATAYLEKAIAGGRPPELITLTIGGNDLPLLKLPRHNGCSTHSSRVIVPISGRLRSAGPPPWCIIFRESGTFAVERKYDSSSTP